MRNLITCLSVCVLSGATFADTWTVDDDGKADFDNIQAAVDAASDGDEIVVMPGTYTSTQDERVVKLYGKAVWLHSSKGAGVTIIDGEETRRGIDCVNGETSKTIISGFTITNGYSQGGGSAIYCAQSASPQIMNCILQDGQADGSGETGGAILCHGSATRPTITDCIIRGNSGGSGGGLCSKQYANPHLVNCTITNNSSWFEGGGLLASYGGSMLLENCEITHNYAGRDGGGGATLTGSTGMVLNNCIISNNTSNDNGGGLYAYYWTTAPSVTYSTICANLPDQFDGGEWIGPDETNYVDDVCDQDSDGINDEIDNCPLYNPDQADCNSNGIGDICDIADFTSLDCDQNSVPDECQPDCDGDGFIDACDNDSDVDGDGIPDNCESDCNENGIPDDFEIKLGLAQDCNNNNIPDSCDMENGTSTNSATATITFTDPTGSEDVGETIEIISQDGTSITYIGHASSGATDREFNVTISKENSALTLKLCLDHANGHAGKIITVDNGDGTLTLTQVVVGELGNTDITETLTNCTATSFTSGSNSNSVDCDANGEIDTCEIESDPSLDCNDNGIIDSCETSNTNSVEELKISAIDGEADDEFGSSIDIDEDRIVVGVPLDDINYWNGGGAYIYRLENNSWLLEAQINSSHDEWSANEDYYGTSVAISGDTVVIGAPGHNCCQDNSGATETGTAYVYRRINNNWTFESKLSANDAAGESHFGYSVSIDGNAIVIGAPKHDNSYINSGAIYAFERVGSTWSQTQKILPQDGATDMNDEFGSSVHIYNNWIIAGAPKDDPNGNESGSAYIFKKEGNQWLEEATLNSSSNAGEQFGFSVSINNDLALIGSPFKDVNGYGSVGEVNVFRFNGTEWSHEGEIIGQVESNFFGYSVSVSENLLLIGHPKDDRVGDDNYGSAYIFSKNDNQWIEEHKITASDGDPGDELGISVSLDNGRAVIGANRDDDLGSNSGSAYIFNVGINHILDCNEDGNLDSCQIEEDPSLDCNADGILDSCQELVDCDENGIADSCDLQDPDNDQNNNGEMDVCECICDITDDGMVNIHDLLILIGSYGSSNPAADFNFDGIVKVHDLLILINAWGACE